MVTIIVLNTITGEGIDLLGEKLTEGYEILSKDVAGNSIVYILKSKKHGKR